MKKNEQITEVPIFPLNNVIVLPDTNLPLNIFEKRYIKMIDFALTQDKRIGMIQKKAGGKIFEKGCIGKITSFNETDDGRYLINLRGENIFSFKKEIKTDMEYMFAETIITNNLNKNNSSININQFDKELFINKFFNFLKITNPEIDLNLLKEIEFVTLIKFVAMSGPFAVIEKQSLLESKNIKELYNKIIILLEFYDNQKNKTNLIN